MKGADLGERNGKLVLDFNFAFNPSCSYDPRWVCPLAPPGNRLSEPDPGRRAASLRLATLREGVDGVARGRSAPLTPIQ